MRMMFKNVIYVFFICCITTQFTFAQKQSKPNVIFIMADDLGIGDLGVYGQNKIETPNIDQMAKTGMKFNQFYSGNAVCAPSRSALMTGQHTGHTPIRGNFEIKPEGQMPLPDSSYTMAQMFKSAGYKTALFGKWGLGMNTSSGDPNAMGFDEAYGYLCQRQAHSYFPDHIWENGNRISIANTTQNQEFYSAELFQKRAMDFLNQQSEAQPFFMYVAFTLPHAALQVPQNDSYFKYYKEKFKEQPKNIPTNWDGEGYAPQAYPHAAYAAMVARMDAYVGQILNLLREKKWDENTIVVFTSDNGAHREGGNEPEFFNSAGIYRGVKRDMYEGGIITPLLVQWPNHIKAGSESDFVGAFWDFLPTFSAVAQKELTHYTDGISMLPTLLGNSKAQQKHAYLYWEFHEEGGRKALRMGDWKLIKYNVNTDKNAPWQLYNLKKDPKEENNLATKKTKIVEKLANEMQKARIPAMIDDWDFR